MKEKIVVIGGGFAGIQFIRNTPKNKYDITLIDKVNHHQFQPLFYQVATSQIEPSSISFPFRKIFKGRKDLDIRLAEVHNVEFDQNKVFTNRGVFDYDKLVIATGCSTSFFGNESIERESYGLKSTFEAIKIRNRIIESFENMISGSEAEKEELQNLVIVGGGPTGVELAGAFAEIKRDILPVDYPNIDFSHFNIILVEGSPNTLNAMSELAHKGSKEYLSKLGVDIRLQTIVKNYDGHVVELSTGETIKTSNVIWAAGVQGNIFQGIPEDLIIRNQRIKVNRFNQIDSIKNVFVLGDISYMETPLYPNGHPQLANVAINQAKNLASNLKTERLKNWNQYEYKDLGSMATIGRNKAIVDLSFIQFKGYFAWYVWMFLHLMLILSVRNKLIIFINWAWNYFTKNSSLRLILKENNHDVPR
ncbi:MAG: NAD(P)/FAD-dependent oxidoreductase [Schleiferiaceae bacterium]